MTTTTADPAGEAAPARGEPAGPAAFAALARHAMDLAIATRGTLAAAPRPRASAAELRALFDVGLPDEGRDGFAVLDRLAAAARPGLVGNIGPGFFGWVMGASHPVGIAADWMATAWGQNSAIYRTAPAAAIAEEVAAGWLLDLLGLPGESSVGFTTGATMASFTCLAAARDEVLRRAGADIDADGLAGAPPVVVFVGEEAHASIFSALRYLGFGRKNLEIVAADGAGRMRVDELAAKLAHSDRPAIVIGQAGHINSGAFDDFAAIAPLARQRGAWLHVDGAFGLWARAVPEMAALCAGVEDADSWAVDGHKWLQVPYESGFAIVRDEGAHKRAMDTSASYIVDRPEDGRNPTLYGPELSRRARGFAVWAVLQALGRDGIAALVRRHCRLARHLGDILAGVPGVAVLNEISLNQLAVAFGDGSPAADALTERVIGEIQKDDSLFVEGATWKGRRIMRVSVTSHETRADDIERLGRAITRAWRTASGEEAVR